MSKSRLTTGVYVFAGAFLMATWSIGWADTGPKKTSPKASLSPTGQNREEAVASTSESSPLATPAKDSKGARSNRIMFESNWKNVQVSAKPMYFQQGSKAFVWTVKNTGDNPVDVGDDYGFSIAPGEEDFIVDTRLVLSVADDKSTTVEVSASRVMTRSELTGPTPANVPTYAPVPQSSATFRSL